MAADDEHAAAVRRGKLGDLLVGDGSARVGVATSRTDLAVCTADLV